MAKIHIILSSKGGIGKSTVASFLIQHLRDKDQKVHAYDTDPSNGTLSSYTDLNAQYLNIMENDRVDQAKFDTLINFCLSREEQEYVVIDIGSSNFIEFANYIKSQSIIETLTMMGHEVILHTIVMGGAEQLDTIRCLSEISQTFHSSATSIIVWLNEYKQKVAMDGQQFEKFPVYEEIKHTLSGIVRLPAPKVADTFGRDIDNMLLQKKTFDEIEHSTEWNLLNKIRISQVKKDIYAAIDIVMQGGM